MGETIAAYRFFDNEEVERAMILEPLSQQTQQRMAAHPVVLRLQDATELDFDVQGTGEMEPLSCEAQRGMYSPLTYAAATERVSSGVLDAYMRARQAKGKQGTRGSLKESLRWLKRYEPIAKATSSLPHTRPACVRDHHASMIALTV